MKKVVISIINYNGRENTTACLESIQKITRDSYILSTIVIDNNSVEPFTLREQSYKDIDLSVVYNKENKGFSGGHNIGIKYALKNNADYVILLNNDCVVDPDFIEKMLVVAESKEEIGLLSPKIYFKKGSEYHKDRYDKKDLGKVIWYAGGNIDWRNMIASHVGVDEVDHGQYDKSGETMFASGCCLLIKKSVLLSIGFLDEAYFLYYEDADFNERAKRADFLSYYAQEAVIWHSNAGSAGGSGSVLQDYYISRNRLRFAMKYAPVRTKFALIKESIKILLSGRKWQKKGVRDFYLGIYGKGSYKNE